MAKNTAVKVKASEITVGMEVRGNLVPGTHTVTEIKGDGATMRAGVQAKTISLYNAAGEQVWIGRTYAKVTLPS